MWNFRKTFIWFNPPIALWACMVHFSKSVVLTHRRKFILWKTPGFFPATGILNQICHWHCISCKILTHFDVRTISVAQKLKKLCLYGPPNCFTVHWDLLLLDALGGTRHENAQLEVAAYTISHNVKVRTSVAAVKCEWRRWSME